MSPNKQRSGGHFTPQKIDQTAGDASTQIGDVGRDVIIDSGHRQSHLFWISLAALSFFVVITACFILSIISITRILNQPESTRVVLGSGSILPTLTPTSTGTPTSTPTPTSTSTPTLTPTPLPFPKYVEIVVDASDRMNDRFEDGFTKIESAWETARIIARKRAVVGQFIKIRYFGGDNLQQNPCLTSSDFSSDFTNQNQQLIDSLAQPPIPGNQAGLVTGLLDAVSDLSSLSSIQPEIILLTGGNDECGSPISVFFEGDYQSLLSKVYVVAFSDEDVSDFTHLRAQGADIDYKLVKNKAEAVAVAEELGNTPTPTPTPPVAPIFTIEEPIPQSTQEPQPPPTRPGNSGISPNATPIVAQPPIHTVTPVISSTIGITPTHIPSATPTRSQSATSPPTPTQTPPTVSPTPTQTPSATPSHTPSATPSHTPTHTPTATSTNTPPPTPTSPPFVGEPLPPQHEVFLQDCWLNDEAEAFYKFSKGLANISANLTNDGMTGQGLELEFDVEGNGEHYSGWEVWLGDSDDGVDLTSFNDLEFFIRSEGGDEKVNVWLMMPVENEEYFRYYKDVDVMSSWQQMIIPLEHFTTGTQGTDQVDLDHIHRIQFVFEWYSQSASGTIYVDDLCVR